jgi:hypothetical protein
MAMGEEQQDRDREQPSDGQPQGKRKGDAPPQSPGDISGPADGRDRPPADGRHDRKSPWLGGG